jgi:hypothetical protein
MARWFVGVVVALLLLLGSSGGVQAGATVRTPPVTHGTAAASARAVAQSSAAETVIRITGFAVDPVNSADIAVRALKHGRLGAVLFDKRQTDPAGAFAVNVRRLPSAFRIIFSKESANDVAIDGKLMVDITNFRPELDVAVINPVTTLVSLLREQRPKLGLNPARARVRRFLGLPAGADLGVALREVPGFDSTYFSMSTFMSEAAQHGGLGKFENLLVKEMLNSRQAVHHFPPGHRFKFPGLGFIAKNLAGGVLGFAGGQGAGWVMSAFGVPTQDVTKDDIANLQNGLNALQTSIANLSQQLDGLDAEIKLAAHETQYADLTSQALKIAGTVTSTEDNLTQYANGCLQVDNATGELIPLDMLPAPKNTNCMRQETTVLQQLRDPAVDAAYNQLANLVLDTTVNPRGMIHLFGLSLSEKRKFFRPADSTAVKQISDFWSDELTQAANLKVELWHYEGIQDENPPNLLTKFLGDPAASPPTVGTYQTNADAQARLLYPSVPDGTVILTTSPPEMWATSVPSFVPGPPPRGTNVSCPILQFTDFYPASLGDPTGLNYGAVTISRKRIPVDSPVSYGGLGGWHSPTQDDFRALEKGFTGKLPDGSPESLNRWLIDQTKAESPESPTSPGFFNIVACSYPYWKPIDPHGAIYMQFPQILSANGDSYLDINNGTIYTQFVFGWWIMLERSLPPNEQYYPYN